MDLLDKIEADMTKLRPVSVKKPQTPLNASPNAWNRQPSGSNTNIKPIEAVPEEKPKPLFFKPGTMPFISTGRIPKRDSKEIEGPNAKRWAGKTGNQAIVF
uniref:Uncharacterized protein n=1 Tax=Caenorhabditis japonica TaxID=281687 RepID=A0A8R1IX68_CAEJA